MSYLNNKITKYIDEEKEKFFDLDAESDYGNFIDFEIECKKEMKIHPVELGPLINCAKEERIKKFEFFPDFEYGVIRRKYITENQHQFWITLFRKGACY